MKSAGGSGWSPLPSLWVCAVGGGNGGKVPVLWLPWVTLPFPQPPSRHGEGPSQFGILLKERSLWRTPRGGGRRQATQRKWGASPWGRRILLRRLVLVTEGTLIHPPVFLLPIPLPFRAPRPPPLVLQRFPCPRPRSHCAPSPRSVRSSAVRRKSSPWP